MLSTTGFCALAGLGFTSARASGAGGLPSSARNRDQICRVTTWAQRPSVLIEEIGSYFSVNGGALSVTLGVGRFVPKKTDEAPKQDTLPTVHVTARLSLSPTAAVQLANALKGVLDRLSKAGAERQKDQKPQRQVS